MAYGRSEIHPHAVAALPRSTPRCPPAPPVVRRRPATRRPRYVRGYCVETKRYYELVYLVRYRYRGTGTSQLSGRAALVKEREPSHAFRRSAAACPRGALSTVVAARAALRLMT